MFPSSWSSSAHFPRSHTYQLYQCAAPSNSEGSSKHPNTLTGACLLYFDIPIQQFGSFNRPITSFILLRNLRSKRPWISILEKALHFYTFFRPTIHILISYLQTSGFSAKISQPGQFRPESDQRHTEVADWKTPEVVRSGTQAACCSP